MKTKFLTQKKSLRAISLSTALFFVGAFLVGLLSLQPSTPVYAVAGEGLATVGGGASETVEISTSNTHTIVLTVGAGGIATNADSPNFTIPAGFTAPEAAPEALIGDVNADGEWFAAITGSCSISSISSSAAAQVITVDLITVACISGDTITITYKGVAPSTADAQEDIDIKTSDLLANDPAVTLTGGVPYLVIKGTAVVGDHAVGAVASTDNLAGLDLVGGTDLVLGGFSITAGGEDVSFTAVRIVVTEATMDISELTNLRIVEDDGTGGGVADNGTMEAGELADPLATVAAPLSGNNDISITTDTVTAGTTDNYFIVGTLAATVTHGDTLDVDADGTAGTAASGVTSTVAITSTGTSANSTRTVTDTTAPTVVNTYSVDTDGDGDVDALDVQFSEAILDSSVTTALSSNEIEFDNDTTNDGNEEVATGGSTTVVFPAAVAVANDEFYRFTVPIGIIGTDAVYLHITGTSLTDANGVAIVAADDVGTPNDKAAPVITLFSYADSDGNGKIDQFLIRFSETVAAASALGAENLWFTDDGDFDGAGFGGALDLISGPVLEFVMDLEFEATPVDTHDDSGSIAISTKNGVNPFLLQDASGNPNTTTGAQTQAAFADRAKPVVTGVDFKTGSFGGITFNVAEISYTEPLVVSTDGAGGADLTVGNDAASTSDLGAMTSVRTIAGIGSWADTGTGGDMTTNAATDNRVALSAGGDVITVYMNAEAGGYFSAGGTGPGADETFTPIADSDDIADAAGNPVSDLTFPLDTTGGAWDVEKPTIDSVTLGDVQGPNGRVDQAVIVFNSAMRDANFINNQGGLGGGAGTFTSGSANDATTTFNLDTDNLPVDTSATAADFTYGGGSNLITDLAGNLVDTPATDGQIAAGDIAETDGALPVVVTAKTIENDFTLNGTAEYIRIEFSEPVLDSSISADDFEVGEGATTVGLLTESFSSGVIGDVEPDVADDEIIFIGIADGTFTIVTSKSDYTFDVELVAGFGGLDDLNSNNLASFSAITTTDGTFAVLNSITQSSALINEALVGGTFSNTLNFNEAMDQSSVPFINITPNIQGSGTLVTNLGLSSWLDTDTYEIVYDVVDVNEEVVVTELVGLGGPDLAGNNQIYFADNSPNLTVDTIAPGLTSAVIQNSTTTTVDVVVTGTDFDTFASSGTATGDATDRAAFAYNGQNPTGLIIDNSTTITATFPIAMGTGKSGGSLSVTASTIQDTVGNGNAITSIVDGSITDSAPPIILSALMQDAVGGDGIQDRLVLTFSENLADTAGGANEFAITSPTNDHNTVTDCTGEDADPDGTANLNVDFTCDTVNATVGDLTMDLTANDGVEDASGNDSPTVQLTSATTPPITTAFQMTAAVAKDTDADGKIDEIDVTFGDTVNITDDLSSSITLSDNCVVDPAPDYAAGNPTTTVTLELTAACDAGTTLTPTVTYTQVANCAASGAICKNGTSIQMVSHGITASDGAAPVVTEYAYLDQNADGRVDQVRLTFGETIDSSDAEIGDFIYTDNDITDSDIAGGNIVLGGTTLSINMGTAGPANTTSHITAPQIEYVDDGTPTTGRGISDAAGNQVVDFGATNLEDKAPSYLVSGIYYDSDGDGKVEEIVMVFSETTTFTMAEDDWAFTTPGDIALVGDFDGAECTGSPGTAITCTDADAATVPFDADANETGLQAVGGNEPVWGYTNNSNMTDAGGNETAAFSETLMDGASPIPLSSTVNYVSGAMTILHTEVIDATPGTQIDLTRFHINNITGTDDSTPTSLTGATVTATDGITVALTLTNTQKTNYRATSGESGGDGGANVLDVDEDAVQDLDGYTNAEDDDNAITESTAAALVSPSVGLTNTTVGQITSFNVGFTTANTWPSDGKVQITFPPQFNVLSASGQTATDLVNISGDLTASVSGLTMTLTRSGGSNVNSGTAVSFRIAGGLNGPTVGATDLFQMETQDSGGNQLDSDNAVEGVSLTAVPPPPTPPTPPSGGGGGGGYRTVPQGDPNKTTSSISSNFTTTANITKTYTRPVKVSTNITKNDAELGIKSVQMTTDTGTILMKPSKEASISVLIPSNTMLSASDKWDQMIMPPLIRSITKVSKLGGVIVDSANKLDREDVAVVIEAGSDEVLLTFDQDLTLTVPVEGVKDGDVLSVYSSPESRNWTYEGNVVVQNGRVEFAIDHLSFYAFEKESGLRRSAPISRFVETVFNDIAGHWAETYVNQIADLGIVSGKTANKFAPNDNITRAEMTKIAVNAFEIPMPSSVSLKPFLDVDPEAWFAPYIKAAKENGVVQGIGVNFKPNDPISRAAALKIIIEAAGFTEVYENYDANYASKEGWIYVFFPDVPIGEWYSRYVAYAVDFGIVGGHSDGTFRAGNPITRAEVAKIVMKVLDLLNE